MNSLYQFADEHYNRATLRRGGLLLGAIGSFSAGYSWTRNPESSALVNSVMLAAGNILPQLTLIPSDRANLDGYLQEGSETRRRTSRKKVRWANELGHWMYFLTTSGSFALGTATGIVDTLIAAKFREMGIL